MIRCACLDLLALAVVDDVTDHLGAIDSTSPCVWWIGNCGEVSGKFESSVCKLSTAACKVEMHEQSKDEQ